MKRTQIINISSKHRTNDEDSCNFNYSLSMNFIGYKFATLRDFYIPDSICNVSYHHNDLIRWEQDGKFFESLIEPGKYDIHSLLEMIQISMNNISMNRADDNVFELSYDSIAERVFIKSECEFSLIPNQLTRTLGFDFTKHDHHYTTIVSDNPVQLEETELFISIDRLTDGVTNNEFSFTFKLNLISGIIYDQTVLIVKDEDKEQTELKDIHVRLLNSDCEMVNLNNRDWFFDIELS